VVTRDKTFAAAGCEVVHSLAEAWAACRGQQEVMVIGGADIYGQALPGATRIYLTEVGGTFEGDTFFPPLNAGAWVEKERESHPPDAKNPHPYAFVTLERV
jgi:dihydrofolate reductase